MTARGIEVRTKLLKLGKTQRDLLDALRERGVAAYASDLSRALSAPRYPREINIASLAHEIVLDWEASAKKKK